MATKNLERLNLKGEPLLAIEGMSVGRGQLGTLWIVVELALQAFYY